MKIAVLGSLNMDLVTNLKVVPQGGETIFGKDFTQIPGGKGANQAVAMGRLRSSVSMLGMLGKDGFAEDLLLSLKESGVQTEELERVEGASGIANILVEENGENRIVVIPGANGKVDRAYVDRHKAAIAEADLLVLQLEIPLDTVAYALEVAKSLGKKTLLNPAPAAPLTEEMIANTDILVPNETELSLITGMPVETKEEIEAAAKSLLEKGVKELLVTLGSKGSLYMTKDKTENFKAYKVKAIDTTAAGDSFIGAFVTKYEGENMAEAIDFASKVASITVTRRGAQSSIPTLEEV